MWCANIVYDKLIYFGNYG